MGNNVWWSRRLHAASALTILLPSAVDRTDLAPSILTADVVFAVTTSIIASPFFKWTQVDTRRHKETQGDTSNMRKPRNRRHDRRLRPHDKDVSVECAKIIQKKYREYLVGRYRGVCRNFDDDDCMALNPVGDKPRVLLTVIGGDGFNAMNLLIMYNSMKGINPLTREASRKSKINECVERALLFAKRNIVRQKGYLNKRNVCLKLVSNYNKKFGK